MKEPNPNQSKPLKNAVILTGIAFQMGAIIYLFVRLGKWLDTTYNPDGKTYIVVCTLAGVGISLYAVVKQLNRFHQS